MNCLYMNINKKGKFNILRGFSIIHLKMIQEDLKTFECEPN